jgi:hypothetical protein
LICCEHEQKPTSNRTENAMLTDLMATGCYAIF